MGKRILIIDDERDMQIYLKMLFRKAGYTAEVAQDGREGLRKAVDFKPDLITLDVLMPVQSGLTAYEALRSDEATRAIPIVILSGLDEKAEIIASGQQEGLAPPEAIFDKPIERDAFLQRVGELIGGPE